MQKTPPRLRTLLLTNMLPRLVTLVAVFSIILCAATFHFVSEQTQILQQQSVSDLKQDLSYIVDDTTRQLADLAANDIIINSLVDLEQRENYLPMFFRSLNLTQARHVEFALFDFAGKRVIDKNWQAQLPDELNNSWRQATLGASKTYSSITKHGVLFSVPVLLEGIAEGALVMHVDSLQSLLAAHPRLTNQVVSDADGLILFSSQPSLIAPRSLLFQFNDTGYSFESSTWKNLTLYSVEPTFAAYKSVAWIGFVLMTMIIGFVLIILHMVRKTGTLAENTLSKLYDNIERKTRDNPSDLRICANEEAQELVHIRNAFDTLMQELADASLSNEQFSNVLESMGDMLVVVDKNNAILLSNKRFDTFCKDQHEEAFDTVGFIVQRLSDTTTDELTHYSLTAKKTRYIRWTKAKLADSFGHRRGTMYVGSDETQKRSLESNVQILTHAMDEATVSIVISDITRIGQPIIYVNSAFEALTGYSRSEIIGHNCRIMQGNATDAKSIDKVRHAVAHHNPIDITLLNYSKNGTEFYNKLNLTPVKTNGEVTHYIGFQQDVTQQHLVEQYLQDAREKAEESARLKSSFLASMSHEIRTPIHGISGVLQLLDVSNLDSDQRRYLSLAKFSIEGLLHIVNDILDFSKIEAGQLQIENAPFDLAKSLHAVENQFALLCDDKGLTLEFNNELNDDNIVLGDEVRFGQILSNLIGNAIKFTDSGSIKVYTKLERQSNHVIQVHCKVIDTGIGIAKNKQSTIFDVFTQEDLSTTREFGGTGLGLSISKQLCELMGGGISLESKKGEGSTFYFTVNMECTEEALIAPILLSKQKQNEKGQKLKILVVEDNDINQIIVKQHLVQHTTLSAKTGIEALEALNKMKVTFDIILMDCQMPQMDGFEATRRIRKGAAGERYIDIPIIAITANAMKGDKERCVDAGMDDYLSKPFEVDDLLKKVERWATSKVATERFC